MGNESPKRLRFPQWITRPQMLVALSALLLSVCGLFISFYEASLMRQAQRASVWPHVEASASMKPQSVELWVRNTGVGPARIEAAEVSYRGETLADWSDLIRRVVGDNVAGIEASRSWITGRVLPVDTRREIILALTQADEAGDREVIERLSRAVADGDVDIAVCYCSVYDECWTSTLQDVMNRSRKTEAPVGSRQVEDCDAAPRSAI